MSIMVHCWTFMQMKWLLLTRAVLRTRSSVCHSYFRACTYAETWSYSVGRHRAGVFICTHAFAGVCLSFSSATPHTTLHLVSVCMHYVLGIASVSLCWSRQSWACPTDDHEEEETEELGQQRQQQRGHHRQQEAQPRHQLQPLQSGTCKHQLHSVWLLLLFAFLSLHLHVCRFADCNGTAAAVLGFIYLNGWGEKTPESVEQNVKPVRWDKGTLRDWYESISPQKEGSTSSVIKSDTNDIKIISAEIVEQQLRLKITRVEIKVFVAALLSWHKYCHVSNCCTYKLHYAIVRKLLH